MRAFGRDPFSSDLKGSGELWMTDTDFMRQPDPTRMRRPAGGPPGPLHPLASVLTGADVLRNDKCRRTGVSGPPVWIGGPDTPGPAGRSVCPLDTNRNSIYNVI